MTVITAHKTEKKAVNEEKNSAEDFLIADARIAKDGDDKHVTIVVESMPRFRRRVSSICVPLAVVFILLTMVVGGTYVYRLITHRTVRAFCKVPYYYEEYDFQELHSNVFPEYVGGHHGGNKNVRHTGVFEELMELDIVENSFEKFDVPAFEDIMSASIVHDFQKNLSAIIDEKNTDCFVMQLDRTLVQPPRDFFDLLQKLGDGYYMPDTEIIKKRYEPVLPPVQDVSQLGYHLWSACRRFSTYLLREVKPNAPVAMVKRSVSDERIYVIAPGKQIQKVMIHMRHG